MRSPQVKIGIVIAILVVVGLGLLVSAMLQQAKITCEVCITFHGRTRCRTAVGPDRQQAVRTAVDNACGLLASGMADSISCANTPPDIVTCDD